MSYYNTRRHIVDTLTRMYRKFEDVDFDDRGNMGDVHKITSDMLYQIRTNGMIYDYRVQVRSKDWQNPAVGYEVDIRVWPEENQPSDNFVLFVLPKSKKPSENHVDAYERAMSII